MRIENLEYIDRDGNVEIYGAERSTLTGESITVPSDRFRNSKSLDIQWTEVGDHGIGRKIRLNQGKIDHAILSQDQKFLVVDFSDQNWPYPWPIGVFNTDGTLRGKIDHAPIIRIKSGRIFDGEGDAGIGITPSNTTPNPEAPEPGIIFVYCYYDFDRIAKVEFIPETMQWGRVLSTGGRA